MRVIWAPSAVRQVEQIFDYLDVFNPSAAAEVAAALIEAGNTLAAFPHRGRPLPNSGMRELVAVPPYVIRYRVAGEAVHILRVRHAARRPTTD